MNFELWDITVKLNVLSLLDNEQEQVIFYIGNNLQSIYDL